MRNIERIRKNDVWEKKIEDFNLKEEINKSFLDEEGESVINGKEKGEVDLKIRVIIRGLILWKKKSEDLGMRKEWSWNKIMVGIGRIVIEGGLKEKNGLMDRKRGELKEIGKIEERKDILEIGERIIVKIDGEGIVYI